MATVQCGPFTLCVCCALSLCCALCVCAVLSLCAVCAVLSVRVCSLRYKADTKNECTHRDLHHCTIAWPLASRLPPSLPPSPPAWWPPLLRHPQRPPAMAEPLYTHTYTEREVGRTETRNPSRFLQSIGGISTNQRARSAASAMQTGALHGTWVGAGQRLCEVGLPCPYNLNGVVVQGLWAVLGCGRSYDRCSQVSGASQMNVYANQSTLCKSSIKH